MRDNLQKQVSGRIWEQCFSLLAFMQFSVRDQGDLAKTELRLSIITILHELMNIRNYTARNTFCLPRGKSGFFFPHLGNINFHNCMISCLLRFYLGWFKDKIWLSLSLYSSGLASLMHVPLSFRCSENYIEEKNVSVYSRMFPAFLKGQKSVPSLSFTLKSISI